MLSQVAAFVFGPFCTPLFFAGFLHAVDFFVTDAAPKSNDSEPQLPSQRPLRNDFELPPCGEPKEMRSTC
jgi:hypothetical protein